MANYWLSFTVKKETRGGRTYDDRRDHIEDVTGASDVDVVTWAETTSYIVFPSPLGISEIGKLIAGGLDADVDKFLIGKVGFKEQRYWGAIEYPYTLKKLYPDTQELK